MLKKIPFHIPFEHPEILSRTLEWLGSQSVKDPTILSDLDEIFNRFQYSNSAYKTYFTQSATQALEIMALSLDLTSEDEIILPSYTYAATANAFARTGAKLIFADIEKETMNISIHTVGPLISKHTKAIIPIHYGGCSADMQGLKQLIQGRNIILLEDAAHGIGSFYKGEALGTVGDMGCLSFHHTKNIHAAGLGGVLFIKREHKELIDKSDQIYHQGTNRVDFLQGNSSKYTWHTLGGEFQMSNFSAAYLLESLKYIENVTEKRKNLFERYKEALMFHKDKWNDRMSLCDIVEGANINGHIFPIVLNNIETRENLKRNLYEKGIEVVTHYEPLHQSVAGKRYGITRSNMLGTEYVHNGLLRLPIYYSMTENEQSRVIDEILNFFKS